MDDRLFQKVKKLPFYVVGPGIKPGILRPEYRKLLQVISKSLDASDFQRILGIELKRAEQQKSLPVYDPNPCAEIPSLNKIKEKSDYFWEIVKAFLVDEDYTDFPLLINDGEFDPLVEWAYYNDLL